VLSQTREVDEQILKALLTDSLSIVDDLNCELVVIQALILLLVVRDLFIRSVLNRWVDHMNQPRRLNNHLNLPLLWSELKSI